MTARAGRRRTHAPDAATAEDRCPHDDVVLRLERRLDRERRARAAAERIAERAARSSMRDELTGLANRRRLLDAGLSANRDRAALCLVDLDGFSSVAGACGRRRPDAALVEVAERLRRAARPGDLVARLDDHRFVVVMWGVADPSEATAFAEEAAAALCTPSAGRGSTTFEVCVGVALGVARGGLRELLADAGAAAAVAAGGGRTVEVFDDDARTRAADARSLERDLLQALEDGEVRVAYQPVFSLSSMRVTGVEALARWEHPVRGAVRPDVFVMAAEQAGIVHHLDAYVLRRAATDLRDLGDLGVGINLSALQLGRPDLVEQVAEVLASTGLDGERLVLEITETAFAGSGPVVDRNVAGLSALGAALAIDDFGTGHASLSQLQRLAVDVLKIDRTFVDGLGDAGRPRAAAIVRAVLGMADALGLRVVGEGIETEAQRDELLAGGCELGQGWLLAPALPLDELRQLLDAGAAAGAALGAA